MTPAMIPPSNFAVGIQSLVRNPKLKVLKNPRNRMWVTESVIPLEVVIGVRCHKLDHEKLMYGILILLTRLMPGLFGCRTGENNDRHAQLSIGGLPDMRGGATGE